MTKRNKIIISISAITAFLAVFLLCTIYDYQISEAIAQLTSGKYLSENKFGAFFEVIGEMPMYVIGVFSACNIIRKAWQVNSKKAKIALLTIFTLAGVFAYTLMIKRMTGYVCENTGREEFLEKAGLFIWFGSIVIGIAIFVLTYYLSCKIPDKYLNGLVVFSIAVLLTIALSQGFVQGVKSIVGRQRFRTMKVLEYYGLNSLIDYSEWFVIHGKRTVSAEMLALGIAKDGYKSFPSGHTCSWAILFTLTILPDFLSLDEKKRVKIKGVIIIFTVLAVLLMAYARVLVGAHFATDTLFAGGWTYLSTVLGTYISKKFTKRLS